MLQPLRTPPLHDAIRRQLKQYIIDRGLRPGDRLPTEEQISHEIGVSRNVVREALRALESIGMIEARRGDGRFVRQFSFDAILDNLAYAIYFDRHSFDELMEVRGELETAFVGRALRSLEESDVEALAEIVGAMRQKAAEGSAFLPEDTAFHARIFWRLGNQLLLRLLDIFWKVSSALQSSGHLLPPNIRTLNEVCDHHARIAEALARRDERAARDALEYHFAYARTELATRLGLSGGHPTRVVVGGAPNERGGGARVDRSPVQGRGSSFAG
jgi:DNA-binding FadR family transcriptional regulator